MSRVNIEGKGQALDGDITTTGARCIASNPGYSSDGHQVLRKGDVTSECPGCGQVGTVVEGIPWFTSGGREVCVDGALVACGCPPGSNRVIAPLGGASLPAQSVTASGTRSGALQPGFYIVPRSMSGPQVLAEVLGHDPLLPISRVQRLNPTFDLGFKAGELFVLGDPDNADACTQEEAHLMAAAARARDALAILDEQEANFMMEHIGEIAGALGGASLSMGVGKDMLTSSLGKVEDTLRGIESLHRSEFAAHGKLNSPRFYESRRALYQQLEAQLRSAFLDKYLSLGGHESLRKGLGISTKSLVHHWSKAGVPRGIPGYATHLDEVSKAAKFLKYGGYLSIGLGGSASYLNIQDVCRAGETQACKQVRLTETGSFLGSVGGAAIGARVGMVASGVICAAFTVGSGGLAGPVCALVLVGGGSYAGAVLGSGGGEVVGETLYEHTY
ncbi:PAAR domain-containing protein [Pseudomonas farsensis]|uniref:PAAR domain-containing protein n=1 Tax=Pseudomonas farsensis TaxID=2745492 RepID=A0ABU8QQ67_9PSED